MKKCELCSRNVGDLTKHHALPKEEGGKEKDIILICSDCHKQIHALYSNKELGSRLNTLEKLKEDNKIKKFVAFIRKQSPTKKVKISKSINSRK